MAWERKLEQYILRKDRVGERVNCMKSTEKKKGEWRERES